MSICRNFAKTFVVTVSVAGMVALVGCGIGSVPSAIEPTGPTELGTIQGSNFGGHAPIVGAKVFVLEATSNGYGAIAKSLLTGSSTNASFPTHLDTSGGVTNGMYYVQTDASGGFNLAGDYTCDPGRPLYLYAAAGNPFTGTAAPNNAIVNMAMLGVCSTTIPSSISFVFMNEVSTVAEAYAMAGFATDSLHIGSSLTNLIGLQNAARNAATLYNIQGGPTSTTADGEGHIANSVNPNNSNGTVPQQTINTLANIVANCVDSTNTAVGTTADALSKESAGCRGLFLAATSNGVTASSATGGSTVPIDTATAMINLAHYPAGINTYPNAGVMDSSNPSTLFNLPTGVVPFSPQLGNAPTDWTIALTYKSILTPSAIAIDASGDAYIGTASATAGYITELLPQGGVNATSTTSVPNLSALEVSTAATSSAVWAASSSANKLYKFSSALAATGTYASTETPDPTALAIDSTGNVYVVGNSGAYPFYISEFSSAGVLSYYYYNYEFAASDGMALAKNGDVWISNTNGGFGLYPNPSTQTSGQTTSVNPISSGGYGGISAVAVDYQGEAWITAKNTTNAALQRTTTGATITDYGQNTNQNGEVGGLNNPGAVAVDGGSTTYNGGYFNVWTANAGNNTVSELNSSVTSSALSPSVGYQSGTGLLNSPSAIAVDNSGNVWVTNQGNSTVTEIIGSAAPVTTPLAAMAPGALP
jgi:hypothetical protein